MAKMKLNIPITLDIEDLNDKTTTFEVVFRKASKKSLKKIIPTELKDLVVKSREIMGDPTSFNGSELEDLANSINKHNKQIVVSSWHLQVSGKDTESLLEYAQEEEIVKEVLERLELIANDIKKKL